DVNPTTAAKIVFGALDEMATNWMLSRRRYALVADADLVIDLVVGGLASRTGTPARSGAPRKRRALPVRVESRVPVSESRVRKGGS
ncbi:MAG: TetR/AcrR family transcriptional regulator C-terminal domain-containing protein, partial [Acidobacteriota bacterium]